MVATDKVAVLTGEVLEETGLQCAICHEGPRSAPTEELGIYVYIRRCPLEEGLSASTSGSTPSTASLSSNSNNPTSDGFTTVSSFVLVHFACHTNVSPLLVDFCVALNASGLSPGIERRRPVAVDVVVAASRFSFSEELPITVALCFVGGSVAFNRSWPTHLPSTVHSCCCVLPALLFLFRLCERRA